MRFIKRQRVVNSITGDHTRSVGQPLPRHATDYMRRRLREADKDVDLPPTRFTRSATRPIDGELRHREIQFYSVSLQ